MVDYHQVSASIIQFFVLIQKFRRNYMKKIQTTDMICPFCKNNFLKGRSVPKLNFVFLSFPLLPRKGQRLTKKCGTYSGNHFSQDPERKKLMQEPEFLTYLGKYSPTFRRSCFGLCRSMKYLKIPTCSWKVPNFI